MKIKAFLIMNYIFADKFIFLKYVDIQDSN